MALPVHSHVLSASADEGTSMDRSLTQQAPTGMMHDYTSR